MRKRLERIREKTMEGTYDRQKYTIEYSKANARGKNGITRFLKNVGKQAKHSGYKSSIKNALQEA